MALAQDRIDVYRQVEAAALSWMDQACAGVQAALGLGKTLQDNMFDLLSYAPSGLILAMKDRAIGLADDRRAPEGGEIDTVI